jgi:hypothetical protein
MHITDSIIAIKSIDPNHEKEHKLLIIPFEYQFAHQDCKSVMILSHGILDHKIMIRRKRIDLRKITTKKNEKMKVETFYQSINGKYLCYTMNINGNKINEPSMS